MLEMFIFLIEKDNATKEGGDIDNAIWKRGRGKGQKHLSSFFKRLPLKKRLFKVLSLTLTSYW